MSRYYFNSIEEPKGDQVKPFAVFGVVTQGHDRLMNTASARYEKQASPAAIEAGLGDLLISGGYLDADKLKPLRAVGEDDKPLDREGFLKVSRWLSLISNAQIDLRCEEVAIVTHKLSGALVLLNEELAGVEWPVFDWAAPEETVRQRASILMAYVPKGDILEMRVAAMAHYRGEKLPAGALGNSRTPSKQISNGAQTASPPTTAQLAQAVSV